MPNVRMFPPGLPAGGKSTTVQGGRNYTAVPGAFVDALAPDAHALEANGWARIKPGEVGPTASRPATLGAPSGVTFIDTTIPAVVLWDGANWRNVTTGAIA